MRELYTDSNIRKASLPDINSLKMQLAEFWPELIFWLRQEILLAFTLKGRWSLKYLVLFDFETS